MDPTPTTNGVHPTRNLSCVLTAPLQISVKDLEVSEVGPDDVKVKVMATGICGSDVNALSPFESGYSTDDPQTHMYDHGKLGSVELSGPMVMGHESVGEVVEVGTNVKDVVVGARVAIEPGIPCQK